jgi:hypothetical protein
MALREMQLRLRDFARLHGDVAAALPNHGGVRLFAKR